MNEIDITLEALAERVRALIQKNKNLEELNKQLLSDYDNKILEIELEKENINNQLTEEQEKRQKDKDTLSELMREVEECLSIYSNEGNF